MSKLKMGSRKGVVLSASAMDMYYLRCEIFQTMVKNKLI